MKNDPHSHPPAAGSDHLLSELRGLIEQARSHVARTANATLTMLYWRVGQRIRVDVLKNERAEYGAEILATVSQQLARDYGKGFNVSALTRMVKFAEAFPDEQIVVSLSRQLTWSHFVEILPLKQPLEREFYAEMCRVERWSVRTLRERIAGQEAVAVPVTSRSACGTGARGANRTRYATETREMKPTPITLPPRLAARLPADTAARIIGVGNAALLTEPLLGLIASRECPGHVLIETLDRVPQWVREGRVILSGCHSPLEQQVLRSLLRRRGRAVKVLARGMTGYRPTAEERQPLADGRMLVITACPPEVRRTTRETALARNRLVLALASEIITPYIADGSSLADLLNGRKNA